MEMSITSVAAATNTTSTTNSSSSVTNITADDFMKLLLTQLENQDPLDPMDTDTFTSELCSLNQLQQATTTNSYLEKISTGINSEAVGYIGKSIAVEGDSLSISSGSADDLVFNLADDASQASISIYDEDGNVVRTITESDLSSGTNSISWDGTDDSGDTLSDGDYTFKVTAKDSSGDSVEATTYKLAKVTGVVYKDGAPYLVADGNEISLDDVIGVYQS
jgi:flagellar basal-body rod modification protein FlgD